LHVDIFLRFEMLLPLSVELRFEPAGLWMIAGLSGGSNQSLPSSLYWRGGARVGFEEFYI
jgi:hypothetical protein